MTAILIVDDEQDFLDSIARRLKTKGYDDLTLVSQPETVPELLGKKRFDVIFLDISMPKMNGLELLEIIKQNSPQSECIMITAHESIPMVIKAVKLGAFDYLVKPVDPGKLIISLQHALERRQLFDILSLRHKDLAKESLLDPDAFEAIITHDEAMLRTLHESELHAKSQIPILVTGETGVGKELLAQAIHKTSPRAKGPFVAVNMLSLSGSLFESEFFGHVKGAFTGAVSDKDGYMNKAEGGTLFLDEIGDLSMAIQGKLLRILQEGEYTKVGKTRAERADVRFVAATNQNLEEQVEKGAFRRDLYFRLRFAGLNIPPLKERREDIRPLALHFIKGSMRPDVTIAESALTALVGHDWPGNVRELKGVIEAAANLAEKGEILRDHLNIPSRDLPDVSDNPEDGPGAVIPLAEVERKHILFAYRTLNFNKTKTAAELGIGLASLHRKLKAYGVK